MIAFSFWQNRSHRALILANLVPLVGVIIFKWDVFSLLLSYWVESGVIGFYNVLKMYKAQGTTFYNENNKVATASEVGAKSVTPEQMKIMRIFLLPFFVVHYGGFMGGHYFFIAMVLPAMINTIHNQTTVLSTALWPMIITAISLLFSHGISYYENFIGHKEYKTVSLPVQMFAPYKRIFVMHLTIILGAGLMIFFNYPPIALVLLICLKIFIDYKMHKNSHDPFQKALSNVDVQV